MKQTSAARRRFARVAERFGARSDLSRPRCLRGLLVLFFGLHAGESLLGGAEHDICEPLAETSEEGGEPVVVEPLVVVHSDLGNPACEEEVEGDANDRPQEWSVGSEAPDQRPAELEVDVELATFGLAHTRDRTHERAECPRAQAQEQELGLTAPEPDDREQQAEDQPDQEHRNEAYEHACGIDQPSRLARRPVVVVLDRDELVALCGDEALLGGLVGKAPGALDEPEQMRLHAEEPAHSDSLGRSSQDFPYPDRKQVALVQEVGRARRVPGDPVAQPVQSDDLVVLEQGRKGPRPPALVPVVFHRHPDRRRALRRPVDVVELADLFLELLELVQVCLLERIELCVTIRRAVPLPLVVVMRPNELGEEGGTGLRSRGLWRCRWAAVDLINGRGRGDLVHVVPHFSTNDAAATAPRVRRWRRGRKLYAAAAAQLSASPLRFLRALSRTCPNCRFATSALIRRPTTP